MVAWATIQSGAHFAPTKTRPEVAHRMEAWASIQSVAFYATVLSDQPGGCTPDGGMGLNPVGCTFCAVT
jgi:hypothetical protein